MPELPEVETIRRGLVRRVLRKKIVDVKVRKPKMVRGMSGKAFSDFLKGKQFLKISRRGKLLVFDIQGEERSMLVHLKMTGQLIYDDGKAVIAGGHNWPPISDESGEVVALPNKYSHVIFSFADGSKLFFNDLRQFGFVQLVSPEEKKIALSAFGVEPLSSAFTFDVFIDALSGRSVSLKAALLNQSLIAGLGNIYVDEVAFRANVRPDRSVNTLSDKELQKIYREIPIVLREAIDSGGTTFRHFRDARGGKGNYTERLLAYGRGGLPCVTCKTVLRKIKVAQRGTTYCPTCQK